MIAGLVSDTHGLYDPRLDEFLRNAELIVHAGDVGSGEVLGRLRLLAPVCAVRGNVDAPDSGWPLSRTLALGAWVLQALHILPAPASSLKRWAAEARASRRLAPPAGRLLAAVDPAAHVVVFGHSHEPCLLAFGGVLWVNPGSAGPKRFRLPRTCALLDVTDERIEARIVPLESCAGALPRPLTFRRDERRA